MSNDLYHNHNKGRAEYLELVFMGSNKAFNDALRNHNPKKDRAFAIAAEVRARRPEMQVKRIEP